MLSAYGYEITNSCSVYNSLKMKALQFQKANQKTQVNTKHCVVMDNL